MARSVPQPACPTWVPRVAVGLPQPCRVDVGSRPRGAAECSAEAVAQGRLGDPAAHSRDQARDHQPGHTPAFELFGREVSVNALPCRLCTIR